MYQIVPLQRLDDLSCRVRGFARFLEGFDTTVYQEWRKDKLADAWGVPADSQLRKRLGCVYVKLSVLREHKRNMTVGGGGGAIVKQCSVL